MRVPLLIVVSFFQCLFASNAKLNPKKSEDILKDTEEDLREYSKENTGRSSNFFKYYNKNVRIPRNSKEQIEKAKNITKINPLSKSKIALVKKPIPKFMDSEEDYQVKVRFPNKFSDSVEHEDEDFNLDDYDFDVNHDEFSSGGKPLEPRKKLKATKTKEHLEPAPRKLEPILKPALSQVKVVIPRNVDKVTNKANKVTREAVDKMKEAEYDEEFPTSTKAHTSTSSMTTDDENSDEIEDSTEYNAKGSLRSIRSPLSFGTYVDKWGEKTSTLMYKILTYLPMFPQVHGTKKLSEDVLLANTPMVDPWNGKQIF